MGTLSFYLGVRSPGSSIVFLHLFVTGNHDTFLFSNWVGKHCLMIFGGSPKIATEMGSSNAWCIFLWSIFVLFSCLDYLSNDVLVLICRSWLFWPRRSILPSSSSYPRLCSWNRGFRWPSWSSSLIWLLLRPWTLKIRLGKNSSRRKGVSIASFFLISSIVWLGVALSLFYSPFSFNRNGHLIQQRQVCPY